MCASLLRLFFPDSSLLFFRAHSTPTSFAKVIGAVCVLEMMQRDGLEPECAPMLRFFVTALDRLRALGEKL